MDINSFALGYSAGKKKGGSGGGAELNIHYSLDTPPEDTSMLWVKTEEEAKRVFVDPRVEFPEGGRAESIEVLSKQIGTAFRDSASVTVGKKIYFFGGTAGSASAGTNTIRVFDTETEEYLTLDEIIPTNLAEAAAACVGNKIYIFGGRTSGTGITQTEANTLNSVFMFDIETETIVQLACVLPNKLTHLTAVTVGSTIYVFGGSYWYSSGSTNRAQAYKSIQRFDVESQTFTKCKGSFSSNDSKYGMAGAAIGTKIYANVDQKKNIYCYDTEKDEVTASTATLPTNSNTNIRACQFDGKIYFFNLGSIWCFDPNKQSVETSDIAITNGKLDPAVGCVGSEIYIISGQNNTHIEKYLPQIGLMTVPLGALKIIPLADDNIFPIINSHATYIEIGVAKVFKGNEENGGERQEAYLYKNGAWVKI
jgi:N-acetylneuraminic acid mutarotase